MYLFQSGFCHGYRAETASVALADDLCQTLNRGNVSLLALPDLSAAFNTIDHSMLLEWYLEVLFYGGSSPRGNDSEDYAGRLLLDNMTIGLWCPSRFCLVACAI